MAIRFSSLYFTWQVRDHQDGHVPRERDASPENQDKHNHMKKLFLPLAVATSLCGCARFTTVQTERRYDDNGKIAGVIETRAGSFTFFDSKSALANFKATQSEKTQSATVGTLNQETAGTNTVAVLEGIEKILRASQPSP